MRVAPISTIKNKKRVIKWENVITTIYITITLFKYFITANQNILILCYDLIIDTCLGVLLYQIISIFRKREI